MANPTYLAIISATEAFLIANGNLSQDKSIASRDLVNHVEGLIKNKELAVDVARSTLFAYISHAANNDDTSGIVSGGNWGGYWYESPSDTAKTIEETEIETTQGNQIQLTERDLYPLIHQWLKAKEFVSKDISNLKSGGKWGNPDVVGVKRIELFGSVEIEIASCEIKLSESGWEQYIFEAISHKRFSNRSWFAYRIPEAGKPLPKAIEYYAERYKVGIIQIFLTNDDLVRLKNPNETILEEFFDRIIERVPALYEHVPLQEKADLFSRAKIVPTFSYL